jgi:hypothetical protein
MMKRNNLSFRRATHVSQKKEEVLSDKSQNFLRFVMRMRARRNYDLHEIGNMDETPIWYDMPGNYTIESQGKKTITMASTGHEKNRVTVMLSALADGTKLKPLVILKGVRPPKEVPTGIVLRMAPQSWANEEIITFWLKNVWGKNNQKRRLLVWDAFKAHITPIIKDLVRQQHNSDMAVIPGGCTHILQPCDVSWNRPFKDAFRDIYDEWLISGPVDLTKAGNRRAASKELILKWIKQAWDAVTPEIIMKSFKVTGITVALDGTEDQVAFPDSDDEDPFEGFTEGEIEASAQLLENMGTSQPVFCIDSAEYSEPSEEEEESADDYENPESPGH